MSFTPEWIAALGSLGSAVLSALALLSVLVAFQQLKHSQAIAQTTFEDGLAREYRDLVARIPTTAMLGESLTEKQYDEAFDELYRYLDLSNEQIHLRTLGRVSKATWDEWAEGMASNLSLPAFRKAWTQVMAKSKNFNELRRLESEAFATDPQTWSRASRVT